MEIVSSLNMMLVYCFVHVLIIAAAAADSIITDKDALLALKAYITRDPTNFLANNWNTSSSVCNWKSVTCDVHNRRVTALNVSGLSLTGTIPSQLGNLSSLQTLDLSHNQFSGTIPSSIFDMSSLLIIYLTNNTFSDELPPNICNQTPNLKSLFLERNMFHGEIPSTLSNCKQLQKLSLSHNNFSGTIPKEIGDLFKLTELDLAHNELQGTLPSQLGNLSLLQQIDLSYNLLSGTIPSSIFNITALEFLDFSDNQLSGPLPASFTSNMSSVYAIDFGKNKLSGEIPTNFCINLPFLEILIIPKNNFHGEVISTLSMCKHLRMLSLLYNDFSGPISKKIGNLTKLEYLLIGYNRLQGEIPQEIGNLRSVVVLDLANNKLVGAIPASLFNLSTMRYLDVADNTLSGSLPLTADIQLVQNIGRFSVWGNNFSGSIPNFIFNASMLSLLDLGDNSFSGFIPNTFGNNLRNLQNLYLANNYLKSSTQELSFLSSLTNCKKLRVIEIAFNPLNGILPRSIGNLSLSLKKFSIFGCNVSGGIPLEISNLTSLTIINFEENKLNGSIPIALGELQKLQSLRLGYNKLEGSIPSDLCHLTELYELYLGGNKLNGSIPACLGSLAALRDLYLGSNELTSTIPSTFWNLKFILYLNFSSNFLTGPLPLEIGNLKVLIDLDLSINKFSGVIPTTIGGLKDLQYLSLGFNRLQGPIPKSLGGLTSLKSLNLSNNNLSGIIPISLEKLLDLKNLNFSFNKLEGEIPKGGPFANFSAASFFGNDLLCSFSNLQVPACRTSTHQTSRKKALLLRILLPLSIVFLVVVMMLIVISQKRRKELPKDANGSPRETLRRFSYLELLRATNEFSENNLIGSGGFGSVYKASLQDGMEIAVKVFHLQFERSLKSFDVECEVMKNIRHRNLVKIITSCSNDDFKALVLEYMPNGSLEKCLYSSNCILDVFQRLNIMIDIASALEYLHFGYSTPIIHCDLKPSNVLLDGNMVAHLSDFGIAKLLIGEDQSMTQTQTLATIGYMAPEYGREGQISTNGDIYSFGIMLMETFTGKKPTNEVFAGDMTLKCWVSEMLPISVMKVVDANVLSREDKHFVAKELCLSFVLNLALECVVELPKQRINAREIVRRLSNIRDSLLRNVGDSRVRQTNLN